MAKNKPVTPILTRTVEGRKLSIEFVRAQGVFMRGCSGDADAAAAAYRRFERLLRSSPSHPVFMAFCGSCHAVLARCSRGSRERRLALLYHGLDTIDMALSLLNSEHDAQHLAGMPVSLRTRHVAIGTFINVPDFCCRLPAAQRLLKQCLATPGFMEMPAKGKEAFLSLVISVAIRVDELSLHRDR